MKIQKINLFLNLFIVFSLLGLLGYELFYKKTEELPSVLIGEPIPHFELADVTNSQKKFSHTHLYGQVSLLNVWATWCYACSIEHDMLMKIKEYYHIPIFGIDYKDSNHAAIEWLKSKGNPYLLIGDDNHGDTAIDFGVYGTPETFVINSQGKIIYRHIGMITQEAWDKILYPLIRSTEFKR